MAGSEQRQSDNSTLLHRRTQLESEQDELRRNVEQLSATTHTNGFGNFDFVARIQGRRATGLEHELESCQTKLNACKKENTKLQEELSEVYTIKSKFAELLKLEVEKSTGLEKEVKFFQTRAAAALTDRDRCLLEIEKYQSKEDVLMEDVADLQDRLEEVTAELGKLKSVCSDLQTDLEKTKSCSKDYEKVIERLWKVREQAIRLIDVKHMQDKAAILWLDSEHLWSYGEMNFNLQIELKQAKDELGLVREEFEACSTSLATIQGQLEAESLARRQVENLLCGCKKQMSCMAGFVDSEIQLLRSSNTRLKEDTLSFFHEEKIWMASLSESWQLLLNKMSVDKERVAVLQDCTPQHCDEVDSLVLCCGENSQLAVHVIDTSWNGASTALTIIEEEESIEESIVDKFAHNDGASVQAPPETVNAPCKSVDIPAGMIQQKEEPNLGKQVVSMPLATDDEENKKALAQALHEKVSALLLLSQQEERHIFEANTTSALESQIAALKQQVFQVTSEKVNALIELARVHEECTKLQGKSDLSSKYRRTSSSGGLLDLGVTPEDVNNLASCTSDLGKKPSLQGYLKHLWLRGPEIGAKSRSLSHVWSLNNRSKETETVGIARLRMENAAFRESLSSIRHLCKSANRLRFAIAKVAAESMEQSEGSIEAAEEAVDGVISEALHLKVALHRSTPVNDLGWNSIGSPLAATQTCPEGSDDGEPNDDLDIVSFFGLEIVRLVLLAAQLQKRCLGQSLQLRI